MPVAHGFHESFNQLAKTPPKTTMRQVRAMLPQIEEAVRSGKSLKQIWQELSKDGFAASYRAFTVYLNRARRSLGNSHRTKVPGLPSNEMARGICIPLTGSAQLLLLGVDHAVSGGCIGVGEFMGTLVLVFCPDSVVQPEDAFHYIRDAWVKNRRELAPLREHVAWNLICSLPGGSEVQEWIALPMLAELPESSRIPLDICIQVAGSCHFVQKPGRRGPAPGERVEPQCL